MQLGENAQRVLEARYFLRDATGRVVEDWESLCRRVASAVADAEPDLGGDRQLVVRASTDSRYGSWNDGKLLNYRKLAVWSWLADSIERLIFEFDVDGIRFDSAHAVPIMMKKLAHLTDPYGSRTDEAMVEGDIVTNEREGDHLVTTGFYDCAARDSLAVPLHTYLMRRIEQAVTRTNKRFFGTKPRRRPCAARPSSIANGISFTGTIPSADS